MSAAVPLSLRVARIADVLAAMPADHAAWLAPSEALRLSGLHVSGRREQFLAGRWLARSLLAETRGGEPGHWPLQQRSNRPPAIVGHESTLALSLSHSGDWIACALSDQAIGIDLEARRRREGLHSFEHLLVAAGEVVGSLDNDALLQRWVAKEAWIKRDHGSALPEQLAALALHRAEVDAADIQLYSTADFHLGVACAATEPWSLDLGGDLLTRSAWQVAS
jgi:4'-phosphopantetheinyl transferase